jgi:hypothetical protein
VADDRPRELARDQIHVPKRSCSTCPYNKATPSGIWSAHEYAKLRDYDELPGAGPKLPEALAVFFCHQTNATGVDTICRGWLSAHRDGVAVRLAACMGALDPADVPTEDEPEYYNSGGEAAEAGMKDIECMSPEAILAARKLVNRGAGRWEDDGEAAESD